MADIEMVVGARKLLEVCANVQPGEEVLVVSDHPQSGIVRAIAAAALAMEAEPVVTYMSPRARDGQEPPAAIAAAMKAAGVFLTPVGTSITHTTALKEAIEAGGRGLVLTQWRDDMLVRGGIEADFPGIAPLCRDLAAAFGEGRQLRVTTRAGTDLEMDIRGRRGNALTCIVGPGEFSPVPTVEANVSPVEGTTRGRIVADVSVPYVGIGILREPIDLKVADGLITSIDGGDQARDLKGILEGFNDPMVFNIAEYGMGLNPMARVTGCMLEDEAVLGTAHIGIGTSITLGGFVKAACHYDLLLRDPTVEVDGVVIADDGMIRL
jgi:2,5-dihydroxypyridine 5,6-dioxygenase